MKKYDRYAGSLYGVFLFLGIGIGKMFGNPGVGFLVGLSLGLLMNAIIPIRHKERIRDYR